MAIENILNPEIELIKKDEFYLFYEMMIQSLKTDNVKEGMCESLTLLRNYLDSGNIILYRKNEEGNYVSKGSDSNIGELGNSIDCIVNKVQALIKKKHQLNLDLGLSQRLESLMLIDLDVEGYDCILAVVNNNRKTLEPLFWNRLYDTVQIIMKRAISYERNTKAITIDMLTGLDNRNSYEKRLESLKNSDEQLVFGIFDLFRLKYINDNFSHDKGDIYIKEVAKILNKYWPKERKTIDADGVERYIQTGDCVYRVGGDEFVLLSSSDDLSLSTLKAGLAKQEAEMISLGINSELPVGLNFGLVNHNCSENIRDTVEIADKLMQEDKAQMYRKNNLERRR